MSSKQQSRIAELATTIASLTQQIDSYLSENGKPRPSFAVDGPVELSLPPELETSRRVVLDATQELHDLLEGPRDLMFNNNHNSLLHFKFISQFNIAREVPVDGEMTFEDLASRIDVDCSAMTRILRLSIAHRVFREPRPGVIAHSAASRQIAEDPQAADWLTAGTLEMWPAALYTVDALQKWPAADEPHQTGFALANGTSDSFYSVLGKDPERARRFGSAMSCYTTGEGFSLRHLTDGYPWSSLGSATVVDIGGSHGDVALALARKFPDLRLVVQDLPEVVASAARDSSLNVKYMAHDFFKEQPVRDADVYFFRWILHNWPDSYAIKILRATIPALKKGARVIIMDAVMPPPGLLSNSEERRLRTMDVAMLEITNAKERDLDDWKTLFSQADGRFVFRGMTQPPGSNLAILEVIWDLEA